MLVALAVLLTVAPIDSSLVHRDNHQLALARDIVDSHREAGTLAPDRAIELVEELAAEWAAQTEGQSETYRRLSTYSSMMVVARMVELVPEGIQCETRRRFAVPSFIADVRDLETQPPSEALAPLFRLSILSWAGPSPSECKLPEGLQSDLDLAFETYGSLVELYHSRGFLSERAHSRLKPTAEDALLRFAFESHIRNRETDAAFAELAARLGAGTIQEQAVGYAGRIARQYMGDDRLDHALAVYDLLGSSLAEETFATTELESAYARLAPDIASERTRRVRPSANAR